MVDQLLGLYRVVHFLGGLAVFPGSLGVWFLGLALLAGGGGEVG